MHLGPALDNFPARTLPLKRTILQRYRSLRSKCHNAKQTYVTETITNELLHLWDRSAIPCKNFQESSRMVQRLVSRWTDAKQEEKSSDLFQKELNTLLDLRPDCFSTLSSLKCEIQKLRGADWEWDYNFFKGQLVYPQSSFMSPNKDAVLASKSRKRAERKLQAQAYAERNQDESNDNTSHTITKNTVSHSRTDISVENEIPKGQRNSAERAKFILSNSAKDNVTDSEGQADDDWELPVRAKRKLKERPKTITLTLPAKEIPSLLANTSTTTKTSARHELKLVSTLLKVGGADINSASLSVSTIHRQRKSSVMVNAAVIRERIKTYGSVDKENGFLVIHWDGKIIQYITGETEERLAIAVSSPHVVPGQFLASPAIANGQGATMADCVYEKVGEFGFLSAVEAMVFDTTASNTGQWKGSVKRFEQKLKRALLWLACRHHIPELFIKHASTAVRGPTTAPEDPMFKAFKKAFPSIDLAERTLWDWPDDENDWRYVNIKSFCAYKKDRIDCEFYLVVIVGHSNFSMNSQVIKSIGAIV